jgi:hypothetical protein
MVALFKIKPNLNAKSLGLILKSYCNLYQHTQDEEYIKKAEGLAASLLKIQSKGYKGVSWGYPFNWTSKTFVPKNTPSSVVTCIVGDAFYSLYKLTNNNSQITVCSDICFFLITELNIDTIDSERICFSYTPCDNNHVHNANLFTAEYLIRIGTEINNPEYIEYGIKALNYSLGEIKKDGSLSYWGNSDIKHLKYTLSANDHYHTGFELRCLESVSRNIAISGLKTKIEAYYKYYLNNYVGETEIFLRPKMKFPFNIHACSEFIILNSFFLKYNFGISKEKYLRISTLLVNTMLDPKDNLFIYEIDKIGFIKIKCKYKFLRWSQAWMFLALTELLRHSIIQEHNN